MDSQRYDELHGSNNWAGLLDPLDLNLRNLLLSYGDFSSAAQCAFNKDEGSKYAGYSHYGKSSFFKGVMLPWADSKYQVTSFIYATTPVDSILPLLDPGMSREGSKFISNWMGFVAVSSDEYSEFLGRHEICVVWRGTETIYELINDIVGAEPVPAEPLLPSTNSTGSEQPLSTAKFATVSNPVAKFATAFSYDTDTPKVMGGWLTIYNTADPNSEFIPSSARTQLLESIKELLGKYRNEKVSITCTGGSLGACLAVLSAFDIARNVVTPDINVSAFIFSSPQVGNESFKAKMEELPNLKVLNVKNVPDIVPLWPSKILKWINENIWEIVPSELLEYVDVGVELMIDSRKSPDLDYEDVSNPGVYHDLQCLLHTLSGWNGENGDFDPDLVKRSLGLVNLSGDRLRKDFKIPVNWWAEKNKGMVLTDDGDWVLAPLDLPDHDLPVTGINLI